jgi:hypothetical protein
VTLTLAEEGSTPRDRPTRQVVPGATYSVVRGHQGHHQFACWTRWNGSTPAAAFGSWVTGSTRPVDRDSAGDGIATHPRPQ